LGFLIAERVGDGGSPKGWPLCRSLVLEDGISYTCHQAAKELYEEYWLLTGSLDWEVHMVKVFVTTFLDFPGCSGTRRSKRQTIIQDTVTNSWLRNPLMFVCSIESELANG